MKTTKKSNAIIIALIVLLSVMSVKSFAAKRYAATSADVPSGVSSFCYGSTSTGVFSDVVNICSVNGTVNTQVVTYHWQVDGSNIPGASGTFTPTSATYIVNETPNLSTLAPGTHTLRVKYKNSIANCGSTVAFFSPDFTITVNNVPANINGTLAVCSGSTVLLTDAVGSGTWSCSAGSASIDASGLVTGLSAGITTVSYTLPAGCYTTATVTTNPLPDPITSSAAICNGAATTATDITPGGTWTIANPAIATVNSSTGVVTSVSVGNTTLSYTLGTGCYVTKNLKVNPLPGAISGPTTICEGGVGVLTDPTTTGLWSVASSSIAMITPTTGILGGLTAGTTNVTYTLHSGCFATTSITVNPAPSVISGSDAICTGAEENYTNAVSGGVWTSSDVSVGTINSTGKLSTVAVGSTYVIYTLSNGCYASKIVAVNMAPAPITGASEVCEGSYITLGDVTTGGDWSSSSATNAIVDNTGTVVGLSAGTLNITYSLSAGTCYSTQTITVNAAPAAIVCPSIVNIGYTVSCFEPVTGGTWSSSDVTIADVDASTGVVTGMSMGFADITYTLPSGCYVTRSISVMPSAMRNAAGSQPQSNVAANGITLSPNPSNGEFSIAGIFDAATDMEATVNVTDIVGKVVYSSKTTTVKGVVNEHIRMNGFNDGIYFVTVSAGSENKTFRIVIAK